MSTKHQAIQIWLAALGGMGTVVALVAYLWPRAAPPASCVQGSEPCTCESGERGERTCENGRSWGKCICAKVVSPASDAIVENDIVIYDLAGITDDEKRELGLDRFDGAYCSLKKLPSRPRTLTDFTAMVCTYSSWEDCNHSKGGDGSVQCIPNPGRYWCGNFGKPVACFVSSSDCRKVRRFIENNSDQALSRGAKPFDAKCFDVHNSRFEPR